MLIRSDFTKDNRTGKPKPGSYEWWYFDAISKTGNIGFVIIFYEGNPFSRRYIESIESEKVKGKSQAHHYPAVSISVYEGGSPIYYGFTEFQPDNARFDSEIVRIKTGGCEVSGRQSESGLVYEIKLDQHLPGGDSIRGTFCFRSGPQNYKYEFPGSSEAGKKAMHEWNLVLPRASVTGEIKISGYTNKEIVFEGTGYHDHNLGREPMKESFRDWYWGRFHLPDATLVYYLMNKHDGQEHRSWLFEEGGKVLQLHDEFNAADYGLNLFGINSARKLQFTGKSAQAFVQQERLIDDGPFYQRFLSKVIVHHSDKVINSTGFTEFIRPDRIYNRLFWPLVNMRISYPDEKPNWVQRNPRLYRWTW